jgi:hypothetical protein
MLVDHTLQPSPSRVPQPGSRMSRRCMQARSHRPLTRGARQLVREADGREVDARTHGGTGAPAAWAPAQPGPLAAAAGQDGGGAGLSTALSQAMSPLTGGHRYCWRGSVRLAACCSAFRMGSYAKNELFSCMGGEGGRLCTLRLPGQSSLRTCRSTISPVWPPATHACRALAGRPAHSLPVRTRQVRSLCLRSQLPLCSPQSQHWAVR